MHPTYYILHLGGGISKRVSDAGHGLFHLVRLSQHILEEPVEKKEKKKKRVSDAGHGLVHLVRLSQHILEEPVYVT